MFYEFKHPLSADYFKVETGTDFSFPAHIHHCFEYISVTDGEMKVNIDGCEYTLHKGESVLLFPNQIHSLSTENNSRHVLCLFSPNLVSAYTSMTKTGIPVSNSFSPNTFLIEKIADLPENPSIMEIKGLLYLLVSEFHGKASYRESDSKSENLIYLIFRFIEENYTKDCTLVTLSKAIGYEYTYLSRFFKKIVGMSYNDYINEYRISKACYLLTNKSTTVLEISCECGFNSLRTFNRNFKKRLGISPELYRNQNGIH